MRLSVKKGFAAVCGAALLVVLTTGATSSGLPGSGTRSARIQPSTSSQCSKPVSERAGAWICPGSLSSRDIAPAASGHCKPHKSWCWTLEPEAGRATWMGSFKYGLGNKNIGVAEVYFLVALSGRESVSKPVRFISTGAVRNVVMEGDRLFYDSKWPAGHPITPRVNESYLHHPASVPAHSAVEWPGGYHAFEKAPVRYGAVEHMWTWNVAGDHATWFVFAQSIHYYFKGKSAFFFKKWQKHMGKDPVGWGVNA